MITSFFLFSVCFFSRHEYFLVGGFQKKRHLDRGGGPGVFGNNIYMPIEDLMVVVPLSQAMVGHKCGFFLADGNPRESYIYRKGVGGFEGT